MKRLMLMVLCVVFALMMPGCAADGEGEGNDAVNEVGVAAGPADMTDTASDAVGETGADGAENAGAVVVEPEAEAQTVEPADIYDLVHARLELPGDETVYEVTDPVQLAELEELLSAAQSIGPADDENGLIFHSYFTLLYLERADGVVGVLYPAEDGSSIWMGNDRFHYYDMGDGGSARVWELFDAPDAR